MTPKERKQIVKRLSRVSKAEWNALSDADKEKLIQNYYAATGFDNLSAADLIEGAWRDSDAINLVMLGLALGIFGSLFATIVDRHYSHFGVIYELIVSIIFMVAIFGFARLADAIVNFRYRHGNLLSKLLDTENQISDK